MRHTLLRTLPLISLLILTVLAPTLLPAQTRTFAFTFMPSIFGDSMAEGHERWIDVSALRQAWSPGWSTSSCTVDMVKGLDSAGPELWFSAVSKQRFDKVVIEVDRTTGDGLQIYYVIELKFAQITNIVTTGALPFAETVTFKAQSMTLSYYPQKPDGSIGAPISKTILCP